MIRVPDLFKFISGEVLKEEVDTRSMAKVGVEEEPKAKKKGVLATMKEPKERGKPDYGKELGEGKIPNPKGTEEEKIKALIEKTKALLEQDVEGEVLAPKIVYISDPDISEEEKLIGVVVEEDEDSYTVQYTETKTKKVKKDEAIPFELEKEEPEPEVEPEPEPEPEAEEKPSESLYMLLDKDSKIIRESSGNVKVFKVEEEAKKEAEKIGARVVEIKK